jgi:hypothetical protein
MAAARLIERKRKGIEFAFAVQDRFGALNFNADQGAQALLQGLLAIIIFVLERTRQQFQSPLHRLLAIDVEINRNQIILEVDQDFHKNHLYTVVS